MVFVNLYIFCEYDFLKRIVFPNNVNKNVRRDILTFWMPVIYTFKFLMEKDVGKIPTILKFWCMISCYNVISLLLSQLLDE
jgi:hypothetical protein